MIERIDGVPVLGLLGDSGSGKTTLLAALTRTLVAAGWRVGCVKHSHHDADTDLPGRDSHALARAGAQQVLFATPARWALFTAESEPAPPDLAAVLRRMSLATLDVLLIEGYRDVALPRIELHRHDLHGAFRAPHGAAVIAVASNQRPPPSCPVPLLDLDDPPAIARFVERALGL